MSADLLSIEQRSDAWLQGRCGSQGASTLHEVVARTKTGPSASRTNRMSTIIVERMTGVPQKTYVNAAMQDGIETEAEARAAYAFRCDVDVTEVGIALHPTIKGTHASPDGLVGTDGLVEIKCPQQSGHLALLLGEPIPSKYIIQMQWQIRCCGDDRKWCDFVSYNPSFPASMRLFIQRVSRDDRHIAELESAVRQFLTEVDEKIAALNARFGLARAA
jgi:putative phage-type endonuclease